MGLIGLLLGKLLSYVAFFLWARRLIGISPPDPAKFALQWASLRLALGFLGILPVYWVVMSLSDGSVLVLYAGLYCIRALIWAGLLAEIHRRHPTPQSMPWAKWIGAGLLLNGLLDLAIHAAGLDDYKFVC